LKKFWIPKNGLQSLPAKLGTCKTLQDLNFENNKFTKLPDSIGQLQGLMKINIAYNGVRWLPESFSTLGTYLLYLFLNFCFFLCLTSLGNLQEIILSDNPALTYVPEYTCFPRLQVLKLRNLQLPCVDPSIQVLVGLRELELRSNAHMGAVPDELGKLVSLTSMFSLCLFPFLPLPLKLLKC
jgi:Leucine-rich repeat (LRR) protein